MCLSACGYANMNAEKPGKKEKPENSISSPRPGVTGSCELPNVGVLKKQHVPLATEHSPAPSPSSLSAQFSGIE